MVEWVFEPPTDVVTFAEKIAYIDSLTDIGFGGMLGIGMMIVIFSVLFLMMKSFRMDTAWAPAALITAVCGILIRVFLPISDNVIYISIVILAISVLGLMKESSNQEI
jgi:hypothetical protein